ncbi:hypothetical protein Q4544_12985 [Cognatishimia sp. 1_MG-2023]|uniref:hypothetical protein n=1 Tax=Cognatishimia sp. 1_MG-2023 TaxID=3062642 RepID=UPI0026E38603|nr:hypothetical protein [Cognatishimia sp. 1_MG-2023]MDO6727849.1 hypothetical protein [Cognatishimia sp. 1_MG-2023]
MPDGWEPIDTAWVAAIALIFVVIYLALRPVDDTFAYEKFLSLKPNEMGDTLAGLFSALAFIGIITTVSMQAKELKAQRLELALTRLEFEGQKEATKDMARSLKAQADTSEGQLLRSNQDEAFELLQERLKKIRRYNLTHISPKWTILRDKGHAGRDEFQVDLRTTPQENLPIDDEIRRISRGFMEHSYYIAQRHRRNEITSYPNTDVYVTKLKQLIEDALELKVQLSEGNGVWLDETELDTMLEFIEDFLKSPVWERSK